MVGEQRVDELVRSLVDVNHDRSPGTSAGVLGPVGARALRHETRALMPNRLLGEQGNPPEVGQGLVTVCAQIARTELGVQDVVVRGPDTRVGSGGSSSASRQTYCTGGAVQAACGRRPELPAAMSELLTKNEMIKRMPIV